MPVSPIEYRYGRNEIKSIFTDESRLRYMLRVESALAYGEWKNGLIPEKAYMDISDAVSSGRVKNNRVNEIEKETKHDVMAMIRALTEQCSTGGSYVHYGVTSNDILDTATALQLKDFYSYLLSDLTALQAALMELVIRHRDTVMVGRTHGQQASPITFGLKMSVYLNEVGRHIERAIETRKRVLVGKILGPVGTGAALGEKALQVQESVMEFLGIGAEDGATQVVDRDRYIEYLQLISNIATSLEKFTTEVRNLQRTEIDEVSEYFNTNSQVGSSSMPSKRNPIESENVCSLARFIRSLVSPEYEAAVTWHERDLTNSALERFTIPYSSVLIDHILVKTTNIFSRLSVNSERMRTTALSNELAMSENVVKLLVTSGMPRQEAHELVRLSAMESLATGKKLSETISGKTELLTPDELRNAMRPELFTGVAGAICDRSVRSAKEIRKSLEGEVFAR
ncbi:MAG: adenylosuccinate lyase [Candidatus Thermoplasmatota archaeon]|nr:adenylosuccinate lyase [Candidatus Thermoplasmatota archaeon]